MRKVFIGLFVASLSPMQVNALGDLTAISIIQQDCVQVGDIDFGANRRWVDCQITKGRWFATIGLVDMYQAQYCLKNHDGVCAQQAQLLFANRAYTPVAKLLVQRIDPGGSEYDDPLVIKNDHGRILTLSARLPEGSDSKQYYLWRDGRWLPIDAQAWQQDLAKRLPKGISARKPGLPDVDTMSLKIDLYRKEDADCCPSAGVASIDLGLTQERFSLKHLGIAPSAK